MAKQIRGDVLLSREGRVLRVTINRPDKHNPLSRAVLAELRACSTPPGMSRTSPASC